MLIIVRNNNNQVVAVSDFEEEDVTKFIECTVLKVTEEQGGMVIPYKHALDPETLTVTEIDEVDHNHESSVTKLHHRHARGKRVKFKDYIRCYTNCFVK